MLFTLVSAEGIDIPVELSPTILRHSLFLQAAVGAGETRGVVPIARASVLKVYLSYLHFHTLVLRLRKELAPVEGEAAAAIPTTVTYDVFPLTCERPRPPPPLPIQSLLPVEVGQREVAQLPLNTPPGEGTAVERSRTPPGAVVSPLNGISEHVNGRYFFGDVDTSSSSASSSVPSTPATPRQETTMEEDFIRPAVASYRRTWTHASTVLTPPAPRDLLTGPLPVLGDGQAVGSYDVRESLEDPSDLFFIEHIVLRKFSSSSATAVDSVSAAVSLQGEARTARAESRVEPTPFLTASQQRLLLELIAAADYLGTIQLVHACAQYLTSWLMQVRESDLLRSFTPSCESREPPANSAAQRWQVPTSTSMQDSWLPREKAEPVCTESPPTQPASHRSVATAASPTSSSEVAGGKGGKGKASIAAAARKTTAVAARKGRKKGVEVDAESTSPPATSASPSAAGFSLTTAQAQSEEKDEVPVLQLTPAQRLAVLAEIKRKDLAFTSTFY